MSYRVRHPRPPLAPGERLAREQQLVAACGPAWRIVEQLLAELGKPPTGWNDVPLIRRVAEQLGWHQLSAALLLARGLTRRGAEDAAAQALGVSADTLRSRERPWR